MRGGKLVIFIKEIFRQHVNSCVPTLVIAFKGRISIPVCGTGFFKLYILYMCVCVCTIYKSLDPLMN